MTGQRVAASRQPKLIFAVEHWNDAMTVFIAESEPTPRSVDLSDLVDEYAVSQYLPPVDWLARLKLNRPRRDIRCVRRRTRLGKRIIDVAGSILLLVLLWPGQKAGK